MKKITAETLKKRFKENDYKRIIEKLRSENVETKMLLHNYEQNFDSMLINKTNAILENSNAIIKSTKRKLKKLNKKNEILSHRVFIAEDKNLRLKFKNKEKDKLIEEQKNKIKELEAKIYGYQYVIEKYKNESNNNGNNSGIPTSQTPLNKNKVIPNGREKSDKLIGGQKGHQKSKLHKFNDEDERLEFIEHIEESCPYCESDDIKDLGIYKEKDSIDYEIIVHHFRNRFHKCKCNNCNKEFNTKIPTRLKEENQYGTNIDSLILTLTNIGNVPVNKIQRIIEGLTISEISLSEGYICKVQKRASKNLEKNGFINDIKEEIKKLKIIHWDDTVISIDKKRACMRFYGDKKLSLYTAHMKKNMEGLDEDNVLNELGQTNEVMHDHNMVNYNAKYSFLNLECNQHLMRDLQKVTDNIPGRTWSNNLKELLKEYDHKRNELIKKNKEEFTYEEINDYLIKFDDFILDGYKENEEDSKPYYAKKEIALLNRLVLFRDNYVYWILDFDIPFTNNTSERKLRGVKSKMKVSGQFKNLVNARYYANIRSYIETCHSNGINEIEALNKLIEGNPYRIKEIIDQKSE